MQNFSLNKAKKEKKNFVESFDQCRGLEVREKARNVFAMSLRLFDHKVVTQHRIFIKFFSVSLRFSCFFGSYFVLQIFGLRNLIKQLFHSRSLDMRLVLANSALRASLSIYHLISNARSWNDC